MPRPSAPALAALAAAAAIAAAAGPAGARGAWQTHLKPYAWNDLLVEGDTLWAATGEAGLVRFDAGSAAFTPTAREPGGLASNDLSSLARDRSGRLWVGTNGAGLSRLDPDGTWGLLNRFDGLRADTITTLAAVGDTLWIGTTRGIAFWNGREIVGTLPDDFNPSPFRSDWITGIVQTGDSLWVATLDGVYVGRLSQGLAAWSSGDANLAPGTAYLGLHTNGDSLFTLNRGGAVLRRPLGAGPWLIIGTSSPGLGTAFQIGTTYRIAGDRGTVVASTNQGTYRWLGTGWAELLPGLISDGEGATTYSAAVDGAGGIWVANRDGLRHLPASGPPALRVPEGPPGNFVLNVALEGSRVYLSTVTEGVGRYDERGWRIWPPVPCSAGCDTTFRVPLYSFALLVDSRSRKWFGQWQVGIEVLEDGFEPPRVTHHVYPSQLTLRTNAWAAAEDSSGGVWFGMDTPDLGTLDPLGLVLFTAGGTDTLNFRPDSIPSMRGNKVHGLATSPGRVWVGYTGQGLQYLSWPPPPGAGVVFVTVPGTENLDVQSIVVHRDSVWVLTTRDVRLYNRSNAAFRDSVLLPAEPASLALRPMDVAPDGTVYVGTTAGLRVIRRGGAVEDWSTANSPLANNEVQAIAVDRSGGAVWIGTAAGLNRWDPSYVAPPPPPPARLAFRVYPNPAPLSAAGAFLRLDTNAARVRGSVHDVTGRLLHRFDVAGVRPLVWDGRDADGRLAGPGIYFVRVEAGDQSGVARVALVR